MAFPDPSEFALKASAGITSTDWLAFPQPNGIPAYEMLRAPRVFYPGGYGSFIDGYDGVRWHWGLMTQAQFAVLTAFASTSREYPNGGRLYCRTWDELASSGAGAFATTRGWVMDPVGRPLGQYYHDVTLDIMGLGAP